MLLLLLVWSLTIPSAIASAWLSVCQRTAPGPVARLRTRTWGEKYSTLTQPKIQEAKIRGALEGLSVGYTGSGEGPEGPEGGAKGSHKARGTP